jgi:hypothetical protein
MECNGNPLNGTRDTSDRYWVREVRFPLAIDTSRTNIHCCWDGGGLLGLVFKENILNGRSDTAEKYFVL